MYRCIIVRTNHDSPRRMDIALNPNEHWTEGVPKAVSRERGGQRRFLLGAFITIGKERMHWLRRGVLPSSIASRLWSHRSSCPLVSPRRCWIPCSRRLSWPKNSSLSVESRSHFARCPSGGLDVDRSHWCRSRLWQDCERRWHRNTDSIAILPSATASASLLRDGINVRHRDLHHSRCSWWSEWSHFDHP